MQWHVQNEFFMLSHLVLRACLCVFKCFWRTLYPTFIFGCKTQNSNTHFWCSFNIILLHFWNTFSLLFFPSKCERKETKKMEIIVLLRLLYIGVRLHIKEFSCLLNVNILNICVQCTLPSLPVIHCNYFKRFYSDFTFDSKKILWHRRLNNKLFVNKLFRFAR